MGDRQFWMTMVYACDRCGDEHVFYLEEGCEGPKDEDRPPPREVLGREPKIAGSWPDTVPWTASGRCVLPVPFVAAGCPSCQGPPPWSPRGGVLRHVRWNEDKKLRPRLPESSLPEGTRFFRYPSDEEFAEDPTTACGIPEIVGVNHG